MSTYQCVAEREGFNSRLENLSTYADFSRTSELVLAVFPTKQQISYITVL